MAEPIKQVILEFNKLETCLKDAELEIGALNQFRAIISERIFTFNKDVDEVSFGSYRSEAYKKKREKEGRQTTIKDLQFSGELAADLELGTFDGKNALGFSTDRSATIVKGQETGSRTKTGKAVMQIDKPVFSANQEEVDLVGEFIDNYVDDLIVQCLNL